MLTSGIFAEAVSFFTWLFMLEMTTPTISWVGDIAVRILTFFTSYSLTGIIFKTLYCFDGPIMKAAYSIVSALVGVTLSYVFWHIEQHLLEILIILCVVVLLSLLIIIFYFIRKHLINDIYTGD